MTAILPRYAWAVSAERFLNSYHNASTPPGPDVPAELPAFMLAVDPVLAQAAELARVLARAHQGAATHLIGEDWSHARKYFSLSEKYAAWADYQQPAVGYGIHAYAHKVRRPIRLTDEAVPLIGFDGQNYGSSRLRTAWRGTSPNRMRRTSSGWPPSPRRHVTGSPSCISPITRTRSERDEPAPAP